MLNLNLLFFKIFFLYIPISYVAAQSIRINPITDLKQSPAYNRNQGQNFPDFTYQSARAPQLAELRNLYQLDSVAGQGQDIDQAIRLLSWFHKQVPHDDVVNLDTLTAKHIIETYKARQYSQGCYPLAIAMNEIFLAMGFHSRVVICFSNSYPAPDGGHSFNAVYIKSLKKWVFMDPQENAYFQDEKGLFLSVAEVRERLINGRPLRLNSLANYHNVPTKKEDYVDSFLAEHMYRITCPLHSEYNSETRTAGKTVQYVELLPYGCKEPLDCGYETKQYKTHLVICFHTSNDDLFWKKPGS
jgi:hypothetical protein